jgi:hypothetical protein
MIGSIIIDGWSHVGFRGMYDEQATKFSNFEERANENSSYCTNLPILMNISTRYQ